MSAGSDMCVDGQKAHAFRLQIPGWASAPEALSATAPAEVRHLLLLVLVITVTMTASRHMELKRHRSLYCGNGQCLYMVQLCFLTVADCPITELVVSVL
jgi:hypothetical protein